MADLQDVRTAVADGLKFAGAASAPVLMTLELNGDAANLLTSLTNKLDRDRGGVIAEALSLLYIGVAVQKEGMQMAIVDQGGTVQTVLDLTSKD